MRVRWVGKKKTDGFVIMWLREDACHNETGSAYETARFITYDLGGVEIFGVRKP